MNLESLTAPSIAAPPFITLPFASGVAVPPIKPHYFLQGFAEWIDSECSDAMFQLRRLSFRAAEIDIAAIYAGQRVGLVRGENDPFGSRLSADPSDVELLADFFFLRLEITRHQHTLDRLAFLHEMALDGVWALRFDEDAQDNFEAQFGIYIESETWLKTKWRVSGLTRCDLIGALLRGDKPAPWYGDAAPQTGADWVREFELWLADRGFERCEMREYIPSATREEYEAMKADGGRMSPLYLLAGEGEALRFLCDDPRTFSGWGALSHRWSGFLDSDRNPVWEAWRDAPGLDDGIAELDEI